METNDKLNENEGATGAEERVSDTKTGQDCKNGCNNSPKEEEGDAPRDDTSEKEEYLRLVRDRFKNYFTEDMERIVGRRVKKYKNELQRLKEGTPADENTEIEPEAVPESEPEAVPESEPERPADDERLQAEYGNSESAIELKDKELSETALAEKISLHADEIRSEYPCFSLEEAMGNASFLKLAKYALATGEMSIKEAYRASSVESIVASAAEVARKETEQRMLSSVELRRARPSENGIGARSSGGNFDLARLTRRDRENIAKRAANGEKIHF